MTSLNGQRHYWDSRKEEAVSPKLLGRFFVRPQESSLKHSSDINHPDVTEPIMRVFLLEHIAQLVAHDFGATNLSVHVRV